MQSQANVLIISTDLTLRSQVYEAIRTVGLQTVEAASAGMGLGMYAQNGADAIILDCSLPGDMDGFATCESIRALPGAENTPILLIIESENKGFIARAYEAGATDFIAKPTNIPVMVCRLLHQLRASQQKSGRLLES